MQSESMNFIELAAKLFEVEPALLACQHQSTMAE